MCADNTAVPWYAAPKAPIVLVKINNFPFTVTGFVPNEAPFTSIFLKTVLAGVANQKPCENAQKAPNGAALKE